MKHSVKNLQLPISFPEMELTFADFFCGCGGFSVGFLNAGLKCISAMDICSDALWSYWYNLCYKGWSHLWVNPENPELKKIKKKKMWNDGKTSNALFQNIPDNWLSAHVTEPMPCLNLFMYSIMDLEPEMWMEMCNVRPGDISIFIGGPPCQGFSTCNHNRNILDERNQLPLRFIYYCKVCKPKIVLMENVPGILTLGKKKGDKEGPFPIWLREKFEDAGYTMEYRVLNAADYGVPQRRKRVFFYAVRKDVSSSELFPNKTHGKHLQQYLTVIEAIGHLPPIKSGERWGKDSAYRAYAMNEREGFVICPQCFHYKLKEREICNNCGYDLPDTIEGGMLVFPEIGMMAGIKQHIDNDILREKTEFLYKEKI
ncbi:MAG: DNA cytosine methyltransferase [Lentimicrobiaceae bacterium]|nr:DNA cytosine methyltransferase [Lentimicrobiaceae bacterium]